MSEDRFVRGTSAGVTRLYAGKGSRIHRERGLPQWTLNYTLEGRGRFDGAGPTFFTEPGDLVLIEPGVLNDYGIDAEKKLWTHLWCVFTPVAVAVEELGWQRPLQGLWFKRLEDGALREAVERLFQVLVDFAQRPSVDGQAGALSMAECLLRLGQRRPQELGSVQPDERILRSLDYACLRLKQPLSVAQLAASAGLSESRFAHLFSEQLGLSPMQYVEQQRLRRAAELLLMTNYPISRVAEAVGFGDVGHFGRVFRASRGVSPREFRKRGGSGSA
jgi:AraC family transcriptional regulator of arabinose operon